MTESKEEKIENQDDAKVVNRPFFRKKNVITKFKKEVMKQPNAEVVKELKQPAVFLMKNAGYIEVLEDMKPGTLVITDPTGEKKSLELQPRKLQCLKYGGQMIKCWVHHEDNAVSYPEEPLFDAAMMFRKVQKIMMNYKDTEGVQMMRERKMLWLYILGGIALVIVALYAAGVFDMINAAATAKPVAQTVVTNASAVVQKVTI